MTTIHTKLWVPHSSRLYRDEWVYLVILPTLFLLPHQTPAQTPTWRTSIAPILYKNCTGCHHQGGSGPFPLITYDQAKRRATIIATATATRYMPPWLPTSGPDVVALAGDRRLSPSDLSLIAAWVKSGTPEGSGPTPTPPTYTSEWQLGPPDLILEMPQSMHVPASGTDLFENFALPVPIDSTRWVRAMEIKPGSPQVTHHANVTVDRTASVRRTHPLGLGGPDWQQGIPGMDLLVDSGDRFDPDSHFLFWKPDSTALVEPPNMPWRLDPGNDLVLNMHLKPTGKPEIVRARIGLYFTPQAATLQPMLLQLEHDAALDIPPGTANFTVEDHLKLPVTVDLLGIYPHAHYLGKHLEAWVTLPSGARKTLIVIPDWDIDRQSVYRLATPLTLPAGTVVHMRYTYDNSAANIRNPHTPPIRVRAGNRSEDEMAHFWLQVLPKPVAESREDPRFALERAWMENRLSKDPRDPLAQFNLAAMLIEEGHPDRAATLYRQVAAENPTDTRSLTALGSALALSGDTSAAETQFRAALARDPTAQAPAFDLASLLLKRKAYSEAEPILLSLSQAHPDDAESQHLLALTYAGLGDPARALPALEAWSRLTPNDPEAHRALAQVYGAFNRTLDALHQQQLVVRLSPDTPADWNDLGVMQARSGDKSAARTAFEHALTLDPTNQAARNNLRRLQ